MTSFAVSLYDPTNVGGAYSGNILACVQAAANKWASYIPGYSTLTLVVNFVSNIGTAIATGGSSYHFPYSATGITTAQSDPISKVVTGVDPNGAAADLYINLNASYVQQLFYDASSSVAVPTTQFDAVSVFAHEIGHGLGFNGFRDGYTGALIGQVQSTFDQLVTTFGGNLYFNGANAQRVYGGPVPIEYGDYGHIGNYAPRPGSSLISDLMFGVIQAGTRQIISQLDLAIMQDIGMPIAGAARPVVVAAAVFNALDYIASYNDLINAFGLNTVAATKHYNDWGKAEHRAVTFNGLDYIASYGDLVNAIGTKEQLGAEHFIQYGSKEGRTSTFNSLDYIASYGDLIQTFGLDANAGAQHFISTGFAEKRSTSFNGLEYIASNADLIRAFGASETAGAKHEISNGFFEGRLTHSFDPVAYLSHYADLRAVYGTNTIDATVHYISFGFAEGRI